MSPFLFVSFFPLLSPAGACSFCAKQDEIKKKNLSFSPSP